MTQRPPQSNAPIKEWARYYHSLGLHPLPVKPGTKRPLVAWEPYQKRQPTLAEIEGWDWRGGIGVVTTGLIVVDCDRGGELLIGDRAIPVSWSVETGSDGFHRYYKGNGQPTRNAVGILKGDNGAQVDIRADGGFIVVPPSTHIQTGRPYRWTISPADTPLVEAPTWIQEAITERTHPQVAGEREARPNWVTEFMQGVPEGQRNDSATRLAGYFCDKGLPEDITIEILKPFGGNCRPPLPMRELEEVLTSIYRTHDRKGELRVEEMGPYKEREEELPAEAPEADMPIFPEVAYQGLAAEIAHTYAECLETPKEFLFMDALTFLGAPLSIMVRLESQLYEEPRLYVVKVGPSWASRKSSSQETIERQYAPITQERLTMCYGTGSAEGLAKRMQSGLPAILVYDEFRSFVDKSGVQQSVLLPMVATLFGRTVYENSTKEKDFRLTDAHLSLVGSCTTETFTTMFTPQFRNIGFLNRLFVVVGKRTTRKPIPETIPHETIKQLQDKTRAQIEKAERERPALRFTTDARHRWEEWYRAMPESPYAARLDTYGLRLLMLYAVTTESWQITRTLVDAVIPLLDYELAVRRELDPIDAEGKIARMERLILRHLSKGRMAKSRLQTLCNVRHYGTWVFEQARTNLMRQGWVKETPVGRGRHLYLTDTGEEAAKQ